MKATVKEMKVWMKSDENIPERFAMYNTLLLACGLGLIASKNVWIKAACILFDAAGAYLMNREMSQFMRAVMEGRIDEPRGVWRRHMYDD